MLDSPHVKNVSISQTALFLFTYTRMKFLSFLTQRLLLTQFLLNKFCQSASLLNFKEKKILCDGVELNPACQHSSL